MQAKSCQFPFSKLLQEEERSALPNSMVPIFLPMCRVPRHLPEDFPRAARVLRRILEEAEAPEKGNPIGSFVFMPTGIVAATRGLGHFDESMELLKALTKRFTSEFAIRPSLREHPERCFAVLPDWTADPDENVRRLVSEGTRLGCPGPNVSPPCFATLVPDSICWKLSRTIPPNMSAVRWPTISTTSARTIRLD